MTFAKRITLFMTLTVLFVSTLAAFPASAASPRLNNTLVTNENFFIDNGVAVIGVAYTGYEGVTKSATISITLERKTLFWWSEVATCVIGLNDWINGATERIELEKRGEYRATIQYTIRGSGGADDVLSVTLYDEY